MKPEASVAWHVIEWTPELLAVLDDSWGRAHPIRVMRFVPLALLSREHPLAVDPPRGAIVVPQFTRSEWGIAASIDAFLTELAAISAIAPGGCDWVAPPAYPAIDATGQLVLDVTKRPATERGYPAALSLSVQLPPWLTLHPSSPIAVAIAAAVPHIPVIVAVGNFGAMREPGDAHDLRNPIARLPGVISVGATLDEQGSALTETSAVGIAGGAGPTVVADGANTFVAGVNQSSFAAPRVASNAALVTAFLLQLRAAMRCRLTGEVQGVPLLVLAYVDVDFRDARVEQELMLPMLPFGLGIDQATCVAVVDAAARYGFQLIVGPNPKLVIDLVLRSARSGPGLPHESGHGTVSFAGVCEMLAALTWRELLALAGHALPPDTTFDRTTADAASLARLAEFVNATRLMYGLDYADGSVVATVRAPGAVH